MTPKTLALALVTTIAFAGTALAAGETPLGNCYNTVILSCNETSAHPIDCADKAMDACDAEHGTASMATTGGFSTLRATARKQVLTRVTPTPKKTR